MIRKVEGRRGKQCKKPLLGPDQIDLEESLAYLQSLQGETLTILLRQSLVG